MEKLSWRMVDDQAHFADDILIVLVIYHVEINTSPAYVTLSKALGEAQQKWHIFIYDNSLHAQSILPNAHAEIHYFHDASNAGVSKAYNQGFKKALELGKKWMLLVDQDTLFPPNTLTEYDNFLKNFQSEIIVPILRDEKGNISPFKFYFGSGQRLKKLIGGRLVNLNDFFFVNSGVLISTSLFQKAGMYDENLPLDFSDLAFVLRLRKQVSAFVLANVVCEHQLSSSLSSSFASHIERFKIYVSAANYFRKNYLPSFWLSVRILGRAVKLSLWYKNFEFLTSLMKR